ncbi:hypothetical protein Naga_100001g131 [Nannochloropsis gaditana]|uniref:Uncharacterized protein n=1 Tax=Nannochloropsis gaditana TaxID=72520 RepID=W7U1M6_9STRA|nr:hypothetical protein Naga_100001g131 [Nannochloropsis gaditana]
MARDSLFLLGAGIASMALLYYVVVGPPGKAGSNDERDDDQPALSKRKLVSVWSMLVKNMELHKYQVQQVLYQQRAQLAQQGTEVPDEDIEAMYKQNFEEILENVQTQILEHFDVAEDEFEAATECYKDDSEVSGMVHQLEALYRGDSGAPGEKDAVRDVGAEELERIIKTDFGEAWCSAFEKTARDFQAQGKDMTEADQELLLEFHTQASGHAQDNLAESLKKYSLTPADFQHLVLIHQEDSRIKQALDQSQNVQREALARLGFRS